MRKPIIALVGRPNVGKSTLFNRLVGERRAVTSDVPGTTRDRLQGESEWIGREFFVVDTGGIELFTPSDVVATTSPLEEGSAGFVQEIKAQALMAIQEADVVIMVVDVIQGITSADEEIAEILRRSEKPVIVAANKADNGLRMQEAVDFYSLGVGEVFGISAMHGTGTGDMLDAVVAAIPNAPEFDPDAEEENILKIAIVGRPNVGKSSLLNRLLGEERVIVSPIAGTTRDSIDTRITYHNEPIILIDTAGIRRRGRIAPGIEKYSVMRTMKSIERADVSLLLIDAVEGITLQDQHVAGMILDARKSVVVIVNKWDAVEKESHTLHDFEKKVRDELKFMPYVPILFISALTGQRIHKVMETAVLVYEERLRRIPTADLNRVIREAVARHAPTSSNPRKLKIYLATQVRVDPPTFLFHVNDPQLLHYTYERYLENCIRAYYPFSGTPIRLSFRARNKE